MTAAAPSRTAPPPTALELIDRATAAAKAAAHACRRDAARLHFEFALALIRESWLAESGQPARTAPQVIADLSRVLALFDSLAESQRASQAPAQSPLSQ